MWKCAGLSLVSPMRAMRSVDEVHLEGLIRSNIFFSK